MECGYDAKPSARTPVQASVYKSCAGYYDADTMGRDSLGVPLLDMLAEVASQTLHSEKKQNEKTTKNQKLESVDRKGNEISYNLQQLLSMPTTQILKQFTIFHSDELKRQYSYTCALIPMCSQKYTSFASEIRARMSIKSHIAEHLDLFKNNPDMYKTFTSLTTKYRKPKTNMQFKKTKKDVQVKKLPENLNKENNDLKEDECTSYLRKILSNESNCNEELNKQKESVNRVSELVDVKEKSIPVKTDTTFLGDHSYFEHCNVEIKNDNNYEDQTNNTSINGISEENIMLMVVESNGVHVKEFPCFVQRVSPEIQEDKINHNIDQGKSNNLNKNMENIVENVTPAKPKGKAKFIGTSKEEREMALALMERIKKKGNPSGSNLQCRICDPPRSFTAPTTLVSHYRSHAGIKPYECRICRAVFTRRHSLKYHMLIHQNQTRFTCADCEKKFRHPSHFREHRRRHTGEAPFGCDDCGQRFKTRNTYKRHLKTRHGKVLTTSGELLCLSEEDFQKVKTNRRKKFDTTELPVATEDSIATNAIIQYQKSETMDSLKDISCDAQNVNDNGAVWMNYCDYESANESQLIKTEFLKTEEIPEEIDSADVKQTYDFNDDTGANLQIMHSDILYNDDPLYSVDSINEYMGVNYDDFVVKKDNNLQEQEEHRIDFTEESCSKEFDDSYSECIKNLEAQNENNITALDDSIDFSEKEKIVGFEVEEQDKTQEIVNTSTNLNDLQSVVKTEKEVFKEENENNSLFKGKTIKVIPQVKILGQPNVPTVQLLKKGKVAILGKAGQILNLSQNGKQNTILLLSTDDSKVMKILKVNTNNSETLKSVAVTHK